MRGLIVALLASCLLLADDVVLQSTARLQSASRIYTGDEEKTNATQNDSLAPHIRYNRVHIVTSPPISIQLNQTEPTVSTNTVDTDSVNKGIKEEHRDVTTTTTAPTLSTESTSYPTTSAQSTSTIVESSSSPSTTTPEATTVASTTMQRPTTTQTPSTTMQQTTTTQQPTTLPPRSTTLQQVTESSTKEAQPQMPSNHHNLEIRSGQDHNKVQRCPRSEDIHPCECVEVATPSAQEQLVSDDAKAEYEVETVAFCKNIRNMDVLRVALRGMQGHHLTYLVMDSVHLPPFPNDLFKNVGIGWMEVLNSTMQFQQKFFQCYEQGCI